MLAFISLSLEAGERGWKRLWERWAPGGDTGAGRQSWLSSTFKVAMRCSERHLIFPTDEIKTLSEDLFSVIYQQVKIICGQASG